MPEARLRIAVVGSGRSVHALARSAAIAALGHEVRLVTLGPVLPFEAIEVKTRPLPRNLMDAVAAARSFVEDVHSFQPHLLHLHYGGGPLGTLATLTRVRPFVVTVMGGDVLPEQHPGGRMALLERRATRRILEAADLILVKSDALRPAVTAFGDFAPKLETVRWGVDARFHRDPAAGQALRRRLGLTAEERVILSPRILQRLYNVHLILESMKHVLDAVPEAVLLVTEYAADADYRRSLEDRVAQLGLSRTVRFIGRLEQAEMPALYSLAEVVVSVPSSDGLPQTLFEAMACQVPVVLGRLPAYTEVVADGTSALFADLTAESVARAVVRVLTDPGLRGAITTAATTRVHEMASLPRESARVVALYQGLVARAAAWARWSPGHLVDVLGLALRR